MNELPIHFTFLICFAIVFIQIYGCLSANLEQRINETDDNFQMMIKTIGGSGATSNKNGQNGGGMIGKILPLLITPFLISSAIIPVMLMSIKVLLAHSFFIGKIAVILMLLNFFRRRINGGGVFNHYASNIAQEHYGYQGVDEPGIYVHKRRRKRDVQLSYILQ